MGTHISITRVIFHMLKVYVRMYVQQRVELLYGYYTLLIATYY